jgi:DNA processing protein
LLRASPADLTALTLVPASLQSGLQPEVTGRLPEATARIAKLHQEGIEVLAPSDERFPPRLAAIPSPPVLLFVKGAPETPAAVGVAVIGTRTPTPGGLEISARVARVLAEHGWCVVSGLARGIDGAAHRAALEAGGRTVAFLPGALDRLYPPEHAGLADDIVKGGGALVSEYLPGTPPHRSTFIERDRLQAGLALAVVPIQRDLTGGTMHTVRFAEDFGRPIYCPTPLDSEREAEWKGIKHLLREGRAVAFDRLTFLPLLAAIPLLRAQATSGSPETRG